MEPLVVAGALAGGAGLAGLAIYAAWRYTRPSKPQARESVELEIIEDEHPATFIPPAPRAPAPMPGPAARPPPPPVSPRSHPERAPAMVLTQGVAMADDSFSRRPVPRAVPTPAAPPRPAPVMKTWAQQVRETTPAEVPTEWARRQVGPVEPGRVAGACGGCGARLSVSDTRPLRIACPVCGRTKLVA